MELTARVGRIFDGRRRVLGLAWLGALALKQSSRAFYVAANRQRIIIYNQIPALYLAGIYFALEQSSHYLQLPLWWEEEIHRLR